ncbi:MAG: alpha/beta hydrolase [Mangrovibacterium sp.]
MKRFRLILVCTLLLLGFLYVIGPVPHKPKLGTDLPTLNVPLKEFDHYLAVREAKLPVKPGNEAIIYWANDSIRGQTDWCLLYLHGFSASREEGAPTHLNFARYFGMNAYLPRLAAHGLDVPEPLLDMYPDSLYATAKEALVVAHRLGRKVVIMSTSTGGTLSLKLAADFPQLVDGLILFSPNVQINNGAAFLLSKPWGLQLARKVYGGNYRQTNPNLQHQECAYWNCIYRLEALVYLQQLVEATMTPTTFKQVKCPVFLGFYYLDEAHQDDVVKVDAALRMFEQLGTAPAQKRQQAFNAGVHVIGYGLTSKAQAEVEHAAIEFGEDVLRIEN